MLRQLIEAHSLRQMTVEGICTREHMRARVVGELCVNWHLRRTESSVRGVWSERVRSAGPLARQREGFARFELRGRRSILARSGAIFPGRRSKVRAALSQGQVQISWQGQHFRGRRSTFARSSTDLVAGQHFRKVKCRFRGRGSMFAR